MRNHLKALLLLALVLALPLRGAAALAGALCECARHSTALAHLAADDGHFDRDASRGQPHHAVGDHAAHDHSNTHPHSDTPSQSAKAAGGCSACASCCLGQALPPAVDLGLIDGKPVNDFFAAAPSRLPDAMPSGMERPPRSI